MWDLRTAGGELVETETETEGKEGKLDSSCLVASDVAGIGAEREEVGTRQRGQRISGRVLSIEGGQDLVVVADGVHVGQEPHSLEGQREATLSVNLRTGTGLGLPWESSVRPGVRAPRTPHPSRNPFEEASLSLFQDRW